MEFTLSELWKTENLGGYLHGQQQQQQQQEETRQCSQHESTQLSCWSAARNVTRGDAECQGQFLLVEVRGCMSCKPCEVQPPATTRSPCGCHRYFAPSWNALNLRALPETPSVGVSARSTFIRETFPDYLKQALSLPLLCVIFLHCSHFPLKHVLVKCFSLLCPSEVSSMRVEAHFVSQHCIPST